MEKGENVLVMAEVVEERTIKKAEYVSVKIKSRENPIWVRKEDIVKDE